MKVALVAPAVPYRLQDAPDLQFPPLALCYLGGLARGLGHDVTLIDMTVSNMGLEELADRLVSVRPDLVGISSLSASFPCAVALATLSKKVVPEAAVVMGGMHPTFTDLRTLETTDTDVVVRNEGEATFAELLSCLDGKANGKLDGVPGITYRDEEGFRSRNPPRDFIRDLDALPAPAYDLLDTLPIYLKLQVFLIITSRGCPYSCAFCSSAPFWGRRWRARSVSSVLEEVEKWVTTYGARRVVFGDDNFAFDQKRVYDLCLALKQRALGIDWRCSVRADTLNKPLLAAMRESGCSALFIGVESGSQASLDRLRKREKVRHSVDAVRWCREVGLETTCAMLLGLPWETEEDVRANIRFVNEDLRPDEVVWNLLHPDPGSEFYSHLEEYGLRFVINDLSRHIGNAPAVVETSRLSADSLNQLWMEACLTAGTVGDTVS